MTPIEQLTEKDYVAWHWVIYWAWMGAEEGAEEDFFFDWYDSL